MALTPGPSWATTPWGPLGALSAPAHQAAQGIHGACPPRIGQELWSRGRRAGERDLPGDRHPEEAVEVLRVRDGRRVIMAHLLFQEVLRDEHRQAVDAGG